MGLTEQTQNLFPSDPDLKDLLQLFRKQILLSLRCHDLGTIQSFDPLRQTATVSLNYKKTFFVQNNLTGATEATLKDYPLILDAPCIVLGGGASYLNTPIQKGDECLVIYNDKDIDNWFKGSSSSSPQTQRLHSFTDAIILVGVRSLPNALSDYDTARLMLTNGKARLGVPRSSGSDLITAENDDYSLKEILTDLNTKLQSLCSELQMLTTAASVISVTGVQTGSGSSGPPANALDFTAIGTNISNISTQIAQISTDLGELLE